MTYRAVYTPRALKGIRHADHEMHKRLKGRIDEICEDPYVGVRLVGGNDYRDKVGPYRIVYEIDRKELQITFYQIERRDKVYKRRASRLRRNRSGG